MLELSLLKIFSSILWRLLKSVSHSFEKLGQWRRSWIVVSTVLQLQIEFNLSWKLSLILWNRRWLKHNLSLVISFKPLGLRLWKVLLAEDLMKANICLLKIASLSEFLILESKLFYSIIAERKKEFLKYSCLTLKRGILFSCLVIYAGLAVGINPKRYLGDFFYHVEKETKFPIPSLLLKGFKAQYLIKCFSETTSYSVCYCKCCTILNRFELFMKRIIKRSVI